MQGDDLEFGKLGKILKIQQKDPFVTNMIIIVLALFGLACLGIAAFVLSSDK